MPFSRKFANDAKLSGSYHRCIYFMPREGTTNEQIIERIKTDGIASYCQPDSINTDGYAVFNDGRFPVGGYKLIANASCCAFTRNAGHFYLFPIHRKDLEGVGLNEQDLLLWIKKFNEQKVGFEYLYFGEQPAPAITKEGVPNFRWTQHYDASMNDNIFYWVGVPIFDNVNILKPYLHWVTLRYLWNSRTSAVNTSQLLPGVTRLAYYNIPRVTMMLHEEYNVPFLKAFLYAHVAHPWSYANSLCYSDYMGIKYTDHHGSIYDYQQQGMQSPCLNLKKDQFKALWDYYGKSSQQTSLNGMLTQKKWEILMNITPKPEIAGIENLHAPYEGKKVLELFTKCDYEGFIREIRDSYKPKKVPGNRIRKTKKGKTA